MPIANQQCACEPCGCVVSPQKAVKKEGKIYCSQSCADGHAGDDKCCSSCDCC
ncbi:metallothionein [Synechococcus sp. MU1651]|uniref:metallothionein n=1 Tax=Synechococcus sp. MU1651 TaxID=2508353 RepID=UPI00202749EB|nr:metallothionein [Synechococcus sp. MU1651]